MELVKIDVADTQASQTELKMFLEIVRSPGSGLGSQEYFMPLSLDSFSDSLFARGIPVGRVKIVYSVFQTSLDNANRIRFIQPLNRYAAETQTRDHHIRLAQSDLFYRSSLSITKVIFLYSDWLRQNCQQLRI
jgi:hypothetical protein